MQQLNFCCVYFGRLVQIDPFFKHENNIGVNIYSKSDGSIWGFPKIVVPQNGWFIKENPIKMDDLGVQPFKETPICCIIIPSPKTTGWTPKLPKSIRKEIPLPRPIIFRLRPLVFQECTLPETNIFRTWKWMVRSLVSFWAYFGPIFKGFGCWLSGSVLLFMHFQVLLFHFQVLLLMANRNPAETPADMVNVPIICDGFYTSQAVNAKYLIHQQYISLLVSGRAYLSLGCRKPYGK